MAKKSVKSLNSIKFEKYDFFQDAPLSAAAAWKRDKYWKQARGAIQSGRVVFGRVVPILKGG